MFSQLVGVQVLVEELKEFVDVLQVQKYGIMKNIRILHDCINNFLLPFFDLHSRRRRRRLSSSDTVLAVTWLGIHRIF